MSTINANNWKDVIEKLSRDTAMLNGDIQTALEKISHVCAKSLDVEEAIIWHFSHDGENLNSIVSHKAGRKTPLKPKTIPVPKIKDYLKAIQHNLYVIFPGIAQNMKTQGAAHEFLRLDIKTSLHVPIYVNGALNGVLQFNQLKKDREWTLADRVMACEAADLAADVLQNFEMRILEKYTPDVVDMLNHAMDHVLKEVNLEHGMIWLDEIPVTRGYSPEVEMEFINQYRILPELTYRTMVAPSVNLVGEDAKRLVNVLKEAGIRSFVIVPIVVGLTQVGCVHVAARTMMEWSEETVNLLEWTARHIAHIVDRIWMRQDNRTLSWVIQSFRQNAQSLNRMMLFEEAIKEVGGCAVDVLETETAFILLRNPDNTISFPWAFGLEPETIRRSVETEGMRFENILRHSKTPVLFPDIHKSILPASLQESLSEKQVVSARIFPLVYEDVTMGAVVSFYNQVRLFTRNERSVLTLFANSAALTLQNAWMYEQIHKGFLGLALALAGTVDAREVALTDASLQFANLAEETARAMKLPEEEVNDIHWAALLHDIGKKDVPESILQKSGPLTDMEWEMVRDSPRMGAMMLEPIPQLQKVAKIIRNYHEHYDGTGYPDGLSGEQIPTAARVLAVADAYTSMIDKRAYRDSRPPQEALREIQQYRGKHFDPIVVDVFSSVAEKYVT